MSGTIRRIDELGRIVLPKEIRKILKINTGDALEISIDSGVVCVTKYLPLSKNVKEIEDIAKSLKKITQKSVLITDRQSVIVAEGELANLKGEKLSLDALDKINKKSSFSLSKKEGASPIKITENKQEDCFMQIIMPIFSDEKDAVGLVAVCGHAENENFDATDIKLLKFVSQMLYNFYGEV